MINGRIDFILGGFFTGGGGPFPQQPIGWVAALVTGWINPLFLVTIWYLVLGHQDTVSSLRIALFLVILCCLVCWCDGPLPHSGEPSADEFVCHGVNSLAEPLG